MLRRLLCCATAVAASLILFHLPALAEAPTSFPSRPITLIVPFQAGVSADLLFRGIADSACCSMGRAAKSGLTRRR